MKNYLKFAAAFAALSAFSPALAETDRAGNRDMVTRLAPGPSRSGLVAPVRVPKRVAAAMADCDCPMMKSSASERMMGMPSNHPPHSKV